MNIIETKNLTKYFGKFCANSGIDLHIQEGEIRAIIGENGAGKTTLMNMLYGILQPTSGEILIRGEAVKLTSPKDAIAHGLGMVHQHFKLVPSLTVYENIMIGTEITKFGIIDGKEERARVDELIKRYDLNLSADEKVVDLSIGAMQRVEILKMLYRDVDVLILDEPTSVLTPQEVGELIDSLLELNKQGKTIIIITHKLQEVKKLARNITVIRHGEMIGTVDGKGASMEDLARMMVGRPVIMNVDKGEKNVDESSVVYETKNLTIRGQRGNIAVDGVSLKVRKGEILGIAGVEGNGQTEFAKTIYGMMTSDSGEILYKGNNITNSWPDEIRDMGIGVIPEDRYDEGLCLGMKVSENLIAGYHGRMPVFKRPFFDKKKIMENKDKMVSAFDIRLSADDPNVSGLSGGNAQKIIIAREFSANPDFLICCQPTRGVDVGSIESIHKQIIKLRQEGKAILLISSELSEIMGLSDRIVVMYKGKLVYECDADNVTAEELGLYMTGAKTGSISKMNEG